MKISTILDKVDENQLFVPAFQREYVWKRDDAKQLIDSLIKEYPTGTMLTWETAEPPELKGPHKYNEKQWSFCSEYIVDYHIQNAALRAKYSEQTAKTQGSKLLTLPKIQERVAFLMDERQNGNRVTVKRVLQELARLSFVDATMLFDEKGNLIPIKKLPEDVRHAIASFEVVVTKDKYTGRREYIKKIKLANKENTLELLGKYLGMFVNKFEDVTPDKPMLTRIERSNQIMALAKQANKNLGKDLKN